MYVSQLFAHGGQTLMMWLWLVRIPTEDFTEVTLANDDTDDKYDHDDHDDHMAGGWKWTIS